MQVAEERGIKAFGQAFDQIQAGPTAQLTAIEDTWGPYYVKRIKMVLDGTWKGAESSWDGLAEGILRMAPYTNMPDDLRPDRTQLSPPLSQSHRTDAERLRADPARRGSQADAGNHRHGDRGDRRRGPATPSRPAIVTPSSGMSASRHRPTAENACLR
jgi:hypothetical protein